MLHATSASIGDIYIYIYIYTRSGDKPTWLLAALRRDKGEGAEARG
jgi:hypothetical protein